MEKYRLPSHKTPEFLYRVQYDTAITQETDKWLLAGDTGHYWKTRTIDEFEEAVDCHLSNWHEPSIFISTFNHRARATEWMARHWFRCDVGAKVFEIDTTALGHKYIYRAKTLARRLDMNTEGLNHHDLDYEYLVLHKVPKSAFRKCWKVACNDINNPYSHRVVMDPRKIGNSIIEYQRIGVEDKKVPANKKKVVEEKKLVGNEGGDGKEVVPESSGAA
ncbi:hypothetical protein N7535_005264 [Penicillium sp. DV-2018c]|nr:hypothetical protein N7461_008843 [Penicillium sp. DV-2018c]KAJ5571604.1 hypothetical protein N7535_005264 [Penicillium sp. DV-2018c]